MKTVRIYRARNRYRCNTLPLAIDCHHDSFGHRMPARFTIHQSSKAEARNHENVVICTLYSKLSRQDFMCQLVERTVERLTTSSNRTVNLTRSCLTRFCQKTIVEIVLSTNVRCYRRPIQREQLSPTPGYGSGPSDARIGPTTHPLVPATMIQSFQHFSNIWVAHACGVQKVTEAQQGRKHSKSNRVVDFVIYVRDIYISAMKAVRGVGRA